MEQPKGIYRTKRCPRCKKILDRIDDICPNCGKKLPIAETAKDHLLEMRFDDL